MQVIRKVNEFVLKMLSEEDDHYSPSVRVLEIDRQNTSCGFHLTRSKWDPYPWISGVDENSPAENSGMKSGDCVLEVNGEDVVGQRISEVAELVRARPHVTLLLWNAGVDPKCSPETLCCGPMPLNMQRLSACMTAIISSLECPVCLNTICPPACQCVNGHLMCIICHAKSEKCPVCRVRLSRGRCLFADQAYTSILDAFGLSKETNEKVRQNKIQQIFKNKNKKKDIPDIKVTQSYANKFLSRLVEKSSSAENLSNHNIIPKAFLSVQNEFQSNLKTKSLSACDISTNSPSRFGSRTNLIFKNKSCHGSFESLNERVDGNLYYCPFKEDCIEKFLAKNILQHFQELHDGPLIQYFKSKIVCKLMEKHNHTYCFIHNEQFLFLRMENMKQKNDGQSDILIWLWLLADQSNTAKYQLQANIYFSETPEKILFSFVSTIYSLANFSWKDIKENKKGTFISFETIKALNSTNLTGELNIEFQIKYNEKTL